MRPIHLGFIAAAALCGMLVGLGPGFADDPKPSAEAAGKAITKGLGFLRKDAVEWKATKKCASCHHGAMTVWAFHEAKRQGYPVDAAALAETTQWTRERLAGLDKPRDPRPGWNMVNTIALYLGVMAQNLPDADRDRPGRTSGPHLEILSRDDQGRIAGHIGRHLEDDGSLLTPATMTPPLPQNGPPPVFESREVLTLLAVLALGLQEPEPSTLNSEPRAEARKKATAFLAAASRGTDTQAMDLRLLVDVQEKKSRKQLDAAVAAILGRQNADGGWGQLKELPSDAYATGQTLYALTLAGVDRKRPEIRKAVSFLIANQRADGSWPMTSRAHPGAKPFTNPVPIGHFGSAWAVIGLVRAGD